MSVCDEENDEDDEMKVMGGEKTSDMWNDSNRTTHSQVKICSIIKIQHM